MISSNGGSEEDRTQKGEGSSPAELMHYLEHDPQPMVHKCRDVVKILNFHYGEGQQVFSDEEAVAFLRKAHELAMRSRKPRDYRAAGSVLVKLAEICNPKPTEKEQTVYHVTQNQMFATENAGIVRGVVKQLIQDEGFVDSHLGNESLEPGQNGANGHQPTTDD